ncbi:MAG: transposase, partial [Cyanobacteria bacterium J06553_1]
HGPAVVRRFGFTGMYHSLILYSFCEYLRGYTVPISLCINLSIHIYISNIIFLYFTGTPGLQVGHLTEASTPRDLFDEFFTEDLWRIVVDETNRYARQKQPTRSSHMKNWEDVDATELQKYLGLRVLMGWHVLPSFHDYWCSEEFTEVAVVGKVMTRDRFDAIRSHIHFNNNEDPKAKDDRLFKIRPVLECFLERFRAVYTPAQSVCVDESLFRYRGRHSCVQFIPTKRSRYGLKAYKLCESNGPATGYTSAMKIYMGDDRQRDQPASFGVVMHLMKEAELFDKGYIVYMDNYYTSPTLFHHLQSRKTAAIGTVRPNRKHMPALVVEKKGDVAFKSSRTGQVAVAWRDKKTVMCLSTLHKNAATVDVATRRQGIVKAKPVVVVDYNKGKAGVDVSDQYAASYAVRRKCVKWYQTLFCHLIDTVVVNAYLIHRVLGGKMSHISFRKDLTRSLCGRDGPRTPRQRRPPPPPAAPAAPEGHALVRTEDDKYRRCKMCSSTTGKRKVNKYECRLCNAGFCPGACFNAWPAHKE